MFRVWCCPAMLESRCGALGRLGWTWGSDADAFRCPEMPAQGGCSRAGHCCVRCHGRHGGYARTCCRVAAIVDRPSVSTVTDTPLRTTRYGTVRACAWNRLHPRLTHRAAWADDHGPLPTIEGSIIRLIVDHLPGDRNPKPVWLWHSRPHVTPSDVDRLWRTFLRRFDLEHTFRFLKQTLGWSRPRVRTAEQGDRWTWLIITAHTQLRLARHLTGDLRRPWEKPSVSPNHAGSPQPASAAGFATSARRPRYRPAHQNRPTPGQAAHPAPATSIAPPATTSAKRSQKIRRPAQTTKLRVKRIGCISSGVTQYVGDAAC